MNETIKTSSLSLYHRAENDSEQFTSDHWTVDAISRFEQSRATPYVETVSPFTGRRISDAVLPSLYLFTNTSNPSYPQQLEALVSVAKTVRDQIMLCVADIKQFGRMRGQFGLAEDGALGGYTSYAIEARYTNHPTGDPQAKVRYVGRSLPAGEVIPAEEIATFVQSFLAGQLTPLRRSVPPPTRSFGRVKRVVGSNFEEIVYNPAHDVLLRMVTPWCLTCNRTTAVFETIAADLFERANSTNTTANAELSKRIVLAEMDVSVNDPPPDVVVHGHPTVLLFPAENKTHPIPCNEWFSYEMVKQFLRSELLKQPRWKGVSTHMFPLTVEEDIIQDENDLINFDYAVEKRKFQKRRPPPPQQANPQNEPHKTSEL